MVVGNKMIYFITFVLLSISFNVHGVLYDRANGNELDYKDKNDQCAIDVKQCGPHEDRRIDGTCNNYAVPPGGASGGPYKRIADLQTENKDIPSARKVRTYLLTTGKDDDPGYLSSAASTFLNFINSDISALDVNKDTSASNKGQCCEIKDKDPRCFPIFTVDDPKSNKDCMEFYRAKTFKDLGCIRGNGEQINFQTPTLDLSQIYGTNENTHKAVRKGEDGMINEFKKDTIDIKKKRETTNPTDYIISNNICVPNANETTCYIFGFPNANNVELRTAILGTWFIREHNRLARALHKLNPCWKDDRLFKVARSINIATTANILLYELLPLLMGYRNMVSSGLVSQQADYVTLYEDAVPLVYAEYEIAMKFFLTLQNGRIQKYDDNNTYIGDLPFNETLYNHEILEKGSNYDEISRGMFIQKAGKVDSKLDPEIGEPFYNGNKIGPDLSTASIQRSRDVGIASYNTYRKSCGMTAAKKFEDFLDVMPMEKIDVLKDIYKTVDDVELIPGIISEGLVPNAVVGPTLYCIMAKQMQLFRYSDRFWFERGDQFHSFSYPQLQEIRKSNMARVACDNSPAIEFIQPRAFQGIGPGNMPLPCSFISGPDLSAWWDRSCGIDSARKIPDAKGVNEPYSYMEIMTFFSDKLRSRNLRNV